MAPKKNRIKAEQALQGESCPDPALPPLKLEAGATRRRMQKPKELRRICCPVKKLQKATKPVKLSFAPFVRLVKEITESLPNQVKRWTPEALLWLQDAAEFFLNETFDVELQLTIRQMRASSSLLGVGPNQCLKLEEPGPYKESGLWFCLGSPNRTDPHPTETTHEADKIHTFGLLARNEENMLEDLLRKLKKCLMDWRSMSEMGVVQ